MSKEILVSLIELNEVESDRKQMIAAQEGSGGSPGTPEYYRNQISENVKTLIRFTKEQVLEVFDANAGLFVHLERKKIADIPYPVANGTSSNAAIE